MDATLQAELKRQGADDFPGFAWKIISSDAHEQIHQALNVDAFELLARGWSTARELEKYADPKLHPPAERSDVFLGEHTLTSTAQPEIVVTVGGVRFRPITLTLELNANFRSAGLTIQNGHIVALHAGDCWVSAQLKFGDQDLHVPLESKRLQLPGELIFPSPGLPIRGFHITA
jgi:hypothetical protein